MYAQKGSCCDAGFHAFAQLCTACASWVDVGPVKGGSTRYCAAGTQCAKVFIVSDAFAFEFACFGQLLRVGILVLAEMRRNLFQTCPCKPRSDGQVGVR